MSAGLRDRIIADVCAVTGHEPADLRGRQRGSKAKARHAVWWLMRELGLSWPEIGSLVGRHHSTVIYGYNCYETDIEVRRIVRKVLRLRRSLDDDGDEPDRAIHLPPVCTVAVDSYYGAREGRCTDADAR